MKIKSDSDDNLPLNKTIQIPVVTIVIRPAFHEKKYIYITHKFLQMNVSIKNK